MSEGRRKTFRFPWLMAGLLTGFCADVVLGPTHYTTSRLLHHPWQYYSVIWAPALGAFCGMVIDVCWARLRKIPD